jgi:hypothetical protein
MKFYITHIFPEKLPEKNYKQISFLVATNDSYSNGIMHLGYNGSRKLTESELSEEISEGKIVRLVDPIIVESKKYLWIDSTGKLWTSNDNLFKEGKEFVGISGLKPDSKSESIFKEIQNKLNRIHKRTQVVT